MFPSNGNGPCRTPWHIDLLNLQTPPDSGAFTQPSTSFSVQGLPTIQGNITCTASFVEAGKTLRGSVLPKAPVPAGVIAAGDIQINLNLLIGAWSTGAPNASGHRIVTTFFANGEYVQAVDGPPGNGGQSGMERGSYTWNSTTGAFVTTCPMVDTNGEWGFSHQVPGVCSGLTGTVTVNGDTVTLNDGTAQVTIPRVTDTTNPLIGSWSLTFPDGHREVITLLANGDYVNIEEIAAVAGANFGTGIERGTYTWDARTGAFTTGGCPAVDTNGEVGLSHQTPGVCAAASFNVTVNGNTATSIGPGGMFTFARVVP